MEKGREAPEFQYLVKHVGPLPLSVTQ